jgi:SPP1 gp7 family putative phage head morphogenesis protein
MPDPVNLGFAFGLPPEKAVAYFQTKGLQVTTNWRQMDAAAHAKAFTITGITDLDLLQDLRDIVKKGLTEGISGGDQMRRMRAALQAKGWWGEKEVTDPETGLTRTININPRRLDTIIRTNAQVAYQAGRYQGLIKTTKFLPFWQYNAVMDSRTRPAHAVLHGKIFRDDDPIWDFIFPPNGFNCRCSVSAMSQHMVDKGGDQVSDSADHLKFIQQSGLPCATIQLPGMKEPFIVDPGWSYNPGKADYQPDLSKYSPDLVKEYKAKISAGPLPEDLAKIQTKKQAAIDKAAEIQAKAEAAQQKAAEIRAKAKAQAEIQAKKTAEAVAKTMENMAKKAVEEKSTANAAAQDVKANLDAVKAKQDAETKNKALSQAVKILPSTLEYVKLGVAGMDRESAENAAIALIKKNIYQGYSYELLLQLADKALEYSGTDRASLPLSDKELVSIRVYTGSGYGVVNQSLISQNKSQLESFGPMIAILNEALEKLPNWEGTAYRGINLSSAKQDQYQVGTVVKWNNFSSCSRDVNAAFNSKNTIFTVLNVTDGKNIQIMSGSPSEKEIILPMGKKVRVVSRDHVGGKLNVTVEIVP